MIAFRPMAVVCLFSAVFAPLALHAQVPAFINFQGRLLNGTNLVNGTVSMDLTLYNSPSGGGFQYVDTGSVVVVDGLYSTVLGDGTALGTLTNALAQTNVYLEVTVNGVTLTPRERLASSAYAIRAARAEIFTGAIQDSQLSTNIARLNATNQIFSGSFAGNGDGVTNVEFSSLNGQGFLAQGILTVVSSPDVGAGPTFVEAADVNGDGHVDLITANYFTNSLTVLTGSGLGEFTSNATYRVGQQPSSIAAVDVTGDGKVDLICANGGTNTLTVLTNSGSGIFFSNATYTVGSEPTRIVAADVNGDARLDLICANYGFLGAGNTLSVLTNTGSGSFVLSSSPVVGGGPRDVAAADVNGDTKIDLITADFGGGAGTTLTVLTNNGSGGFTVSSSPIVGSSPTSLAAVDVNGDGRVDLVSAIAFAHWLSVLTNNGSGGFALASTRPIGYSPLVVKAADFSDDGAVDLVVINDGFDSITVLVNDGLGEFAIASIIGVGLWPQSIAAADFNGDGKADLATADFLGNALSVLLNAPKYYGSFSGDGSDLLNAAGWVRNGGAIYYSEGNVGIGTNSPTNRLHVVGTVQATAYITSSDRNLKEKFQPVAADDILAKVSALPISTWHFKTQDSGTHLGPMAQDFHAAFGLGNTDSGIFTVDESGVALAAIQALYKLVQDQDARLAEQQRRIQELEQQLHAR